MKPILIFFLSFLLLIGSVTAADVTWAGNQHGRNYSLDGVFNITAINYYGSGAALTGIQSNYSNYSGNATYATTAGTALTYSETDPVFVANRTDIWNAIGIRASGLITSNGIDLPSAVDSG